MQILNYITINESGTPTTLSLNLHCLYLSSFYFYICTLTTIPYSKVKLKKRTLRIVKYPQPLSVIFSFPHLQPLPLAVEVASTIAPFISTSKWFTQIFFIFSLSSILQPPHFSFSTKKPLMIIFSS